ncbi:hypothetical protein PV08_00910 [Exophiala spinifera]|uniref:Cytochrome P450 n=1 Tax=Exophiala spinifera TaxID=91928 RepID=A0A0D2BP81_9EURO|nr:uncharacterized protein PV08_00910 [Exophiala spinifera]KIW20335.1 hypothetical protein PV08_00910 [Exophiala spinifera]
MGRHLSPKPCRERSYLCRLPSDYLTTRRPPDTLPIVGNAIHFLKPRHVLFDWFVKCQNLFGHETFEISVPTLPPGVVINSPENLEFVLKSEAAITKGEFFRSRSWDLFGYGIINATGDLWRAQRKAGLKFFSGANLDALIEDVLPEVYTDMTRRDLLQAANDGSIVDLQTIFHDLTTTVVGHMAYDMEISASSSFSKAFDHASSHIGLRFQNPLYRLTELFTASGGQFHDSLSEVKRFGREIVLNARKRRSRAAFESLITDDPVPAANNPDFHGTLIDSLIESFADPQVVADSALNFLSAGRDTTAQALTWTFYALLRHPSALDDIRTEIAAKVPLPQLDDADDLESTTANTTTTTIDISSLQPTTLPLTVATFYEALRLYPPVPFEIKQTTTPVTLPDGTYLPAGAVVVWCIWAFNRARATFGDDAHLFRPRRWIDDQGRFTPKSPFEFPVFNGGPRACLGKKMAEVMAVWVMIRMCTDWDVVEEGQQEQDTALKTDGTDSTDSVDNATTSPAPRTPQPRRRFERGKSPLPLPERVSANSLTLPMEGGLPCRIRVRARARKQ